MNKELWQQVEDLFNQIADLQPDEQMHALAEACKDNRELYDRVAAMLAADRSGSSVLDASIDQLAGIMEDSNEKTSYGSVDSYRLTRKVGSGGMGVVYEAERDDDQFTRRVAIKRIKRGMDTEEIIRRFRNERQILANLNHPNIARLLDGGIHDDTPYFVMEYVDGTSITEYADTNKMDVTARLVLFQSVCSAVQHAHRNLVVHRDLKPSNILVTSEGDVKLLDFGIAKVLEADQGADETRTGQRAMTPAYASPEQMRGESVTTSTDVFSLGVVLFELLTGRRPFSSADRDPRSEPVKPSTVVTRPPGGDQVSSVVLSQARSTTESRLSKRLRGDLDTIVLKALQAEPERRYQSADQFLDDIKRHLAGLPVAAQPDTFGYRAGKFVRRHRLAVGVSSFLVMLIVAFAVAMAYQQQRTAVERDTAREVASFLESMFDSADPYAEERLDTLRVHTLLERGADQVNEGLRNQPEVQARMLNIIGRVNARIGRNSGALPMLQQALTIRTDIHGKDHLDVAETHLNLGDVHYALGSYEAADSSFSEALRIRQALLSGSDPLVAEAMSRKGQTQHRIGNLGVADSLYQGALHIQQSETGDTGDAAVTMSTLASLYDDQGEYAKAESLHVVSLEMRRRVYDENHPAISLGLRNLAIFLRNRNRYDEAEPVIREAIGITRASLGPEHPNLVTDLNTLGGILRRKRDYVAADSIFAEVLDLRRRVLGSDHPDVSITLDSYARVMRELGEFDRAVAMQREAIAIARNVYGEEHMSIAITTGNLASILRASGDPVQALPSYREALSLYEKLFSPDHPNAAVLRSNTAGCLIELGRYAEAEQLLNKSYAVLVKSHGLDHRLTQSSIRYYVTLYKAWGRPDKESEYAAMIVG
ncbi:MAG: serine/threonine protein kinase [Rhodothermales bacterium]|nr:serine/threonine protein kinase [Rhodothermales bacterium]